MYPLLLLPVIYPKENSLDIKGHFLKLVDGGKFFIPLFYSFKSNQNGSSCVAPVMSKLAEAQVLFLIFQTLNF